MRPFWKLALQIALCTGAVLVLGVSILAVAVYRNAPRAVAPEMVLQLGHSAGVRSVAFSPDGQTLASASDDHTVKLWDSETGALLRTIVGHQDAVGSVAFSPDGRMLASAGADVSVKLWNPETGALLRTLAREAGELNVRSLAFSSDGKTLVSAGSMLKLWSPVTGEMRTLVGDWSPAWSVALSPDGRTLASASSPSIDLFNPATGTLLRTLAGDRYAVLSVAFSADGQTLASAGVDKTVKLWNPATGELRLTLAGHQSQVWSVAFSPDGHTLASASADNTVKIWKPATGALLRTLTGHQAGVWSVAFSPDGHTLASASGDSTVKLWDTATGAVRHTLATLQRSVNLRPQRPLNPLERTIRGSLVTQQGAIASIAFSPDGQRLASGGSDRTVRLWDQATGELLGTLAGHQDVVTSTAFSPDGQMLASGGWDAVRLWNPATGAPVRIFAGDQDRILSVAFSPNGQTLASASADRTVKLWNPATGALLRTLVHSPEWPVWVAFSPDGQTLAASTVSDNVTLWNPATGALVRTFHDAHSAIFSPDGRTLASASADSTVKLWDPATGALLRTLAGHQSYVSSLAFSPYGQTLASASGDSTIKLWNVATGALIHILAGHQNSVNSVAFSPDGRTLASASSDGSIRQWRVTVGEPESVTVILPGTEWMTYNPRNLFYTGSQQATDYASIRFDSKLRGLYPLSLQRYQKLKLPDARQHLSDPHPDLQPDLLYDAQTMVVSHRGQLGAFGLVYLVGVSFALVFLRRADPLAIARRFFAEAGLKTSAPATGVLMLSDAFALMWDADVDTRVDSIRQYRFNETTRFKLYLIYRGQPPSSEEWTQLRDTMNCDVIPLESSVLNRALSEGNCAERLRDMEEPFVVLTDPYDRTTPLTDATLFFGHADVIEEIPMALRQGQHTAIFGLRRIGKTSVIRQIENRLLTTPFASFEIISHETANGLFTRVLKELGARMGTMRLKGVPDVSTVTSDSEFRDQFLKLYTVWEATGSREPFVVMLDEAERLFPARDDPANEADLMETARFFRVLRALAQERHALVILAAAYRPNLNRWNRLGQRAGENAMFQQYREVFLSPLNPESTRAMLTKLGLLRGIEWTEDALAAAYDYSGGHPQLARFFASDVSEQGTLKRIDAARVQQTADEIRRDFRRHRISTLLKESIWLELTTHEQSVLTTLAEGKQPMSHQTTQADAEALTDLELLGIVTRTDGSYHVGAGLFLDWLKSNVELSESL